jgi:uncharacterized membrane protein
VTRAAIALCLLVQVLAIAGQLFLKRAMSPGGEDEAPSAIAWGFMLPGIASFTVWFFLWLGILAKWEVSQVYPFDALNATWIALAARVVLKERLPARGWLGIALITAGIAMVSQS